ncbi:MAG: aminopeptidase P family protein [Rhodothermia bacterium]|nr:MAG: aminopeptidase P family protein [Rhodothermia bacterium]
MSTSDSSIISNRQNQLRETLKESQLDAIAINPGPSLVYLTGLHFHLSERPVVFLFPVEGTPSLVLPELEMQKVESASFEIQSFSYGESLDTWGPAFESGTAAAGLDGGSVGVEPGNLRVLELRLLEGAAPNASFVSGAEVLASLRMHKDENELNLMREATRIAEKALLDTLPNVKENVTEREISASLIRHMLERGSDGELPFQPIVAFGANSANPHAVPSDYALQQGDLVLFDWGANYRGYFSDLTRMFAFGEPEPELRKIVEIVQQSNAAGRRKTAPGRAAGDIDFAARSVIEEAGYGEFFTHRTGHGLGLEVHEAPFIRGDNNQVLEPGMTFTVEPGIYLNGRGGARIEDDMVVTQTGGESISTITRDLGILGI